MGELVNSSLREQSVLSVCGQSVSQHGRRTSWLHLFSTSLITRTHPLHSESSSRLPGPKAPLCPNAQLCVSARCLISALLIQGDLMTERGRI